MSHEGKKKKRVTIIDKEAAKSEPKITHRFVQKDGKEYVYYLVTYFIGGKRKRKQFRTQDEAEAFSHQKSLEMKDLAIEKTSQLTKLTPSQLVEAENAIDQLGEAYTLTEAIEFFLINHRSPDYTINLKDGLKVYLDEMERSGIRERTKKGKESVLGKLRDYLGNPDVHTLTEASITAFLRSLRAQGSDGKKPASRKTWNNYRNEINHFCKWCGEKDLVTHRPWMFTNPCESITTFTAKQVSDQRDEIIITEAKKTLEHMSHLMNYKQGALVKFYALAYFAGIRPDGELKKLADLEVSNINLKTRTIHIPAKVSKTGHVRQVNISENLAQWLKAYKDFPIIPTNFDRMNKEFRAQASMSRDETRHTFISFYVAKHRSLGDAALQAGNSETIIRKHYLNLRPSEDGETFFRIVPDMKNNQAILGPPQTPQGNKKSNHLKAI